jgi:pimeloyl-ACP methyl ester carboxylesterase
MAHMRSSTSTPSAHLDFSSIDRLPRLRGSDFELVVGRLAPVNASTQTPAMLFVPGAYHGAWCYAHYLRYFAQRQIDCCAIDLPGHGLLADAAGFAELGIEDLGGCVRRACGMLDRPVVIVGHSMGAVPAMLAASHRRVRGLVLLAPSPPGNLAGAQALPAVPHVGLRPPPDEDEIRRRFVGADEGDDVSGVVARLSAESSRILNDRYLLRVSVDPAGITCPGICFEAERDDPARHPAGQDEAIARFLGLAYRCLPDQPHSMMYGAHWQASADAIFEWYAGQFGASSTPDEIARSVSPATPY